MTKTKMDSHSADSRVVGEEADVDAVLVAVLDSADDEPSLHIKQVGVLFVTAGTVPMNYSGGPRCTAADVEIVVVVPVVVAAVVVVAVAAFEQVAVAALIHSDLHFDRWKFCLQM